MKQSKLVHNYLSIMNKNAKKLANEKHETVFIMQTEVLKQHDETIRRLLLQRNFEIVEQNLFNLTEEQASIFVEDISNQPQFPDMEVEEAEEVPHETDERVEENEEPLSSARSATRTPNGTPTSTPRKTPRTPRSEVSKTPRLENDEDIADAIHALSNGPIVVMLLQKEKAFAELLEFVGPPDPKQWAKHPDSLRAQFGISEKELGVRSSKNFWAVDAERNFFFCKNINKRMSAIRKRGVVQNQKSDKMSLDTLLKFTFPPNVQHPNSTGRLYVFALYGPLDSKSRLRSGEKGMHIVSNIELNTMCHCIEREDILSVYSMAGLSADEEEEVIRQADKHMKMMPRYTVSEVTKLFSSIPRDNSKLMRFHDMQRFVTRRDPFYYVPKNSQKINEARYLRVIEMKTRVDKSIPSRILKKISIPSSKWTKDNYEIAPPSMFMKNSGLNESEQVVLVSKLLNRSSFQICNIESGNSPELTQNVKLLRDDIKMKIDRPRWDDNCGVRRK